MDFKLVIYICLSLYMLIGCKKKQIEEVEAPDTLSKGILVLNEGLFQLNNSSLGWINFNDDSYTSDFFEQKTGRSLGDTGNDLKRYGGKIYVLVSVSSTVEILDAITGKSLKQISMIANGIPKQPRHIAFYGSKAYVTCFDGFVDVIDTTSLTITKRIPVGSNPEGLAVSNGKLFVANSGGLNAPILDSTLSVIDLSTDVEVTKIVVGKNPRTVVADPSGEIYVITDGPSVISGSRMKRIDANSLSLIEAFSFDAGGICSFGNYFLIPKHSSNSGQNAVALFDTQTKTIVNPDFLPISNIQTLYSIQYHPGTNKIYCMDTKGFTVTGKIHVYSTNGVFEKTYNTGLNPSKLIIYE